MAKHLLCVFSLCIILASCSKDDIEQFALPEENIPEPTKPAPEPTEENPVSELEKTSNWIANMQTSNGLLESSENTDFVSLYDNALAALLFVELGELEKAEHILDFFEGKIQTELKAGTGGFFQYRNRNGEDANRTWMGDNAWLLIAINHYHEASGNQEYLHLAEALENWLRSLQDVDGGLWGGRNEDGSQIPKVTEGIITAFNAISGYDDFHKNILSYLQLNRWSESDQILLAGNENSAYRFALDLHTLSQTIFEEFPENNLAKTDQLYLNSQWSTVAGEEIFGYCFDTDKDVIWLEGTAQMAVAFQQNGDMNKADELIIALEKTFIASFMMEDSKGIPYTTNPGTNYGATLLWDHADIAPALSSTAWYLFAKLNFNPLELGRPKNIPVEDMFW